MKTNKAVKKAIQKKLFEMSFYEFFCKAFEVIEPSVPFSANWHHKYLCDILQEEAERITKGEQKTKDIIVNIPFRSTKSLLVTVLYPVWCWVINPKMKFITASYSAELSIEHATKSRDVIFSDWFTNLWGEYVKIKKDQNYTDLKEYAPIQRLISTGTGVELCNGATMWKFYNALTEYETQFSGTAKKNKNEIKLNSLYHGVTAQRINKARKACLALCS